MTTAKNIEETMDGLRRIASQNLFTEAEKETLQSAIGMLREVWAKKNLEEGCAYLAKQGLIQSKGLSHV